MAGIEYKYYSLETGEISTFWRCPGESHEENVELNRKIWVTFGFGERRKLQNTEVEINMVGMVDGEEIFLILKSAVHFLLGQGILS